MDIPSKSRRSLQKLIFPSNQNLINPLTHWIASSNTEKSSKNQPYHAISISSRHLRGSCRSVCSDLGSNHPRPRFWKVFQSRLPVKHRNWVESYTNAGTARFYYDLVSFLLFSCLGFPEDLRKTNAAKVRRKLEIRWRKNAKHSHTSVLKQEKCDKAPWLMSGTPFVESTRLQQPWKWIKWIKWISQLLNPQKMPGVAGPSYIVFDPGEWFRFIGCRYGQPRIGYQPSKSGGWKLETTLYPHLMSAPPPSSSSSPVSNLSIS